MQTIRLHQGSTSTPRGWSYIVAPQGRTGGPRWVQGHQCALIPASPQKIKLQEPCDSGPASPKQVENYDLQRAKGQLQARARHPLCHLPVTSLQRAKALRKAEIQMGKRQTEGATMTSLQGTDLHVYFLSSPKRTQTPVNWNLICLELPLHPRARQNALHTVCLW